jgi:hypothetical protein
VENGSGRRLGYFGDSMLNYPMWAKHGETRQIPPARLIVELTQEQLERLNKASGELGPVALLRSVALALADQANDVKQERRRAAFADDQAVPPR